MKKYGLQLRAPTSQQKKNAPRPPLPPPLGFRDDEDDDVEREIAREATKKKSLKDVEELHKKALEEDPSVFDYDSVYDDMKGRAALPRAQDQEERKPKYIQSLMKKAEERKREQDIIYERKLEKERSKEDHLYSDKDKYVTTAYKNKLAEQAKWIEEDRIRQLREERDDVTKRTDLSDFYFNLEKNVAFGGRRSDSKKQEEAKIEEQLVSANEGGERKVDADAKEETKVENGAGEGQKCVSDSDNGLVEDSDKGLVGDEVVQETAVQEPNDMRHKRDDAALNAAKERFLARKKAKIQ